MQGKSRAPRKKSVHQELRNENPHKIAHPLPLITFMASLWIRLTRKGLGVVGELCHVVAHFGALKRWFLWRPLFRLAFFTSLDRPLEQCESHNFIAKLNWIQEI